MGKLTPTYLKDEDVAEVADFLGLDFEYCRQRILNYDVMEMAEAWHKADPNTPKEISYFYGDNNLYLFELTKANASEERMAFHGKTIDYLLNNYPQATHPKVLDFGAGVGTDLIRFSKGGYGISFADIPGKTADFIRYRFKRRNIKAAFIPIDGGKIHLKERYDIIICFDVLEHVPDPQKALSVLTRHLKNSGVIAVINCPDDEGGGPTRATCRRHFCRSGSYGD